jgi:tyrosyl-tRNA synthetase
MIGDPSGRSVTRPQLTRDEVAINAKTYREQAFKILDPPVPALFRIGEWFESMPFEKVLRLKQYGDVTTNASAGEISGKELITQQPIHAHEIQYPIMQGWDSVMVQADVELGGPISSSIFWLDATCKKQSGQAQQVVLVLPILEGLDGTKKMSKSLGNYVGLNEPASEIFGKLMSISDELMGRYLPSPALGCLSIPKANPLEAKKHLAAKIVETYHSHDAAQKNAGRLECQVSVRKKSVKPTFRRLLQ